MIHLLIKLFLDLRNKHQVVGQCWDADKGLSVPVAEVGMNWIHCHDLSTAAAPNTSGFDNENKRAAEAKYRFGAIICSWKMGLLCVRRVTKWRSCVRLGLGSWWGRHCCCPSSGVLRRQRTVVFMVCRDFVDCQMSLLALTPSRILGTFASWARSPSPGSKAGWWCLATCICDPSFRIRARMRKGWWYDPLQIQMCLITVYLRGELWAWWCVKANAVTWMDTVKRNLQNLSQDCDREKPESICCPVLRKHAVCTTQMVS